MSKTATPPQKDEIIAREVGEQVDVLCNIDNSTVKELGEGLFEAVVTTSAPDRHGENIATEGIETENYMLNPVVLYGHDYSGLPIGKAISLKTYKNKLTARFQLATDILPFADTVGQMIKAGYLNAVSIGGRVLDWSEDYRTILKMEMVEFSVVPVPANSQAIITGRSFEKAIGKSAEQIKEEFEDASRQVLLDKLSGFGDDKLKSSAKVLKDLAAALEEQVQTSSQKGSADTPEVRRVKHIKLLTTAKATATQSQKVIKIIKTS